MGSVMEITLQITTFGQRCINRFNYYNNVLAPAGQLSLALADAFGAIPFSGTYPIGGVIRGIANILAQNANFDQIIVKNIYDPTDFYETAFTTTLTGVDAGDALSPAMAAGFRTSRVRSDIKRGTKRFSSIVEAVTESGGVIAAAALSGDFAELATRMSADISGSDGSTTFSFEPIVCGKQCYDTVTQAPCTITTPANQKAYRYYPTLTEQEAMMAQNIVWSPYDQIRTQTSRQYGRGQ